MAKRKDYVDSCFISKEYYFFDQIANVASELFSNQFFEKLFKMQLGYFKGINYDEEVTYLIPNPPSEQKIQDFLINVGFEGLQLFYKLQRGKK
jgi:hypothetical protein